MAQEHYMFKDGLMYRIQNQEQSRIFSDLSYSVQGEMSTYVSAYFGYAFKVFMLTADASLGLSSSWDFFLGGEMSHSFHFLNENL